LEERNGKKPCISFLTSALHDKAFLNNLRENFLKHINQENVRDFGFIYEVNDELIEKLKGQCNSMLAVVSTGGTEHIMLSLREKFKENPIVFLAHNQANSLPALIEATPLLKEFEKTSVIYTGMENAATIIKNAILSLRAYTRIFGSRLGLIGGPSPWLVYSKTAPEILSRKMGITLVSVPLEKVIEYYDQVKVDTNITKEIVGKASSLEVSINEINKAIRIHYALEKILTEYQLDAFTIKCFDIIKHLKTTACISLSLFNTNGIIAGCEGDVPATIAMMMLSYISGKPSFVANPGEIKEDRLLLAHCTAAFGLENEGYILKTHFESGLGVGIALKFIKDRDVTLLRLSKNIDKARIIKGKITEGEPKSKFHCRSQMWVKLDVSPKIVLERSMGNHYVVTYGDHTGALSILSELFGIKKESY